MFRCHKDALNQIIPHSSIVFLVILENLVQKNNIDNSWLKLKDTSFFPRFIKMVFN